MKINYINRFNFYQAISILLIFLAFLSFFLGFYFDENSAGAGGPLGDFTHIYNNFNIFLNNDLKTAIAHPDYADNRPPTSYILHNLLNPFAEDKLNYRRSVFLISLTIPILFYFSLKKNFKDTENVILILISSTILLSPYFRTTAFWGLQENYAFFFLFLTFISMSFLKENNNELSIKDYAQIIIITFLSSACFYFDQKLIIIPSICFFKIILSNNKIKLKFFTIICYFIFSLPYIYFMKVWGSLIPVPESRPDGLYIDQLGYTSTIIAFYLLPLLFFKETKLNLLIKNFFLNKKSYLLILPFILYLFFLLTSYEFSEKLSQGNGYGYIHKISILIFDDLLYRSIFVCLSFFISWIIILISLDKKVTEYFVLIYFFILSIIMWPMYQEYFDPVIIVLAFTFFNLKIYPKYLNSIILYIYLSIFLISANIYYLL